MQDRQLTIRHGYAQLDGVRLHYAESGNGNDLVLLLHGFPEFWYSWRHQLSSLGKHFHVVAPDMRGYNLSDKPSLVVEYSLNVLVEDVVGLIKHFAADKAAIVGHDWGAAVAWAVAQKYPDHVSKLAVMQVPPAAAWRANITLKQLLRSWYMFFFQLPSVPEWAIRRKGFAAIERVFNETVARKGSFSAADIELYKEALRRPGALTAAVNYYRANVRRLMVQRDKTTSRDVAAHPLSGTEAAETNNETDGRIRVPTLFIFGEQDFAILPRTVLGVGKYVNAAFREVRIADSGHWVQNEAVSEVNAALLEFLLPIKESKND
jgi:pimeloyl-ACP methyl ester carboxylesterase